MENSLALRIGLLLVGAAVIALVYFFGTKRARNRKRFRKHGRVSRINPVDAISAQQSAEEKSQIFVDDSLSEQPDVESSPLYVQKAVVETNASLDELPKVEKDPRRARTGRGRKRDKNLTQIEMSFGDAPSENEQSGEQTDRLLTLYVLPPTESAFTGESIVEGLNAVGLKYGEMEIFHHYGAGRLKTEQPLFSVANMLEPGTFDMNRIERFNTPGLVFFLQLPTVLDGAVSFELFLNTAQRLTEALGGELFADPKRPLDSAAIEEMRKLAAEY